MKIDVKCKDNEEEENIDMETLNKFLETCVSDAEARNDLTWKSEIGMAGHSGE